MNAPFFNSDITVLGTEQNFYDLKSVFAEYNFKKHIRSFADIPSAVENGEYLVVCGDNKEAVLSRIAREYDYECVCTDDTLIETLQYPLQEKLRGKVFCLWGTGYWADCFLKWYQGTEQIAAFVDNDPEKQGKKKAGIPILAPEELQTEEAFLVVAVNHFHFAEIEKQMIAMGIPRENYVSVHVVMDNVPAYFRKVYCSEVYYPIHCKNQDENIRIKGNGDVCTCCMARESVYGNILLSDFEEIWNSKRAAISRLSLKKQAYRFCDPVRCPYLSGASPQKREGYVVDKECPNPENYPAFPNSIAPEIDVSCNLYCFSCRDRIISDTSRERDIYTDVILKKVSPLPGRLIINTIGEPFASKNSLRVIHDPVTRQRRSLSVYTNGTLLTPSVLDRLMEEYETIELSVSVDAATKETYEKLRRGGDFDNLMNNLSYIKGMRQAGKVTYLQLNFVVQADNVHEMNLFAKMAGNLCADFIGMNAIENWGHFSKEQFDTISIMDTHGIKREYIDYFDEELVNNEQISFHNISNYLGIEPRKMYMI